MDFPIQFRSRTRQKLQRPGNGDNSRNDIQFSVALIPVSSLHGKRERERERGRGREGNWKEERERETEKRKKRKTDLHLKKSIDGVFSHDWVDADARRRKEGAVGGEGEG